MSDSKDDSDIEILECEETSVKPKLQIFDGNVVISQELTVEEVHSLLAQINSRLVANPADFPNLTASKDDGSEVEVVLEERRQPSTSSSLVISVEEHDYSGTGHRNIDHMQIEVVDKDGEPIKLPDNLESVPKAEHFPTQRHRWNTNEEIAAILISFDRHSEWQSKEVKIRPKSGSMLLYSRKKVRYRRDGYCWKKRKDGKTTREDHMKLKVQGTECIYGCYVHSAILPTFHRRCYWLLQNPDIVLVHYLNVPYPDDNKLAVIAPSLALWGDKKEWTKEELVSQLKPMFYSEEEPDLNNELEITTAETVEAIVTQLMEKQRLARQATLSKQLECGCPDSTCADGKACSHPMRRITANVKQERQVDNNNQVSSTTGSGVLLANNSHHHATIHHRVANARTERQLTGQSHQSPLVLSLADGTGLSLSQIQAGTGLLILNSSASSAVTNHTTSQSVAMVTSFKCNTAPQQTPPLKQYHHPRNKVVIKQESMDTNQSCCRQDNSAKCDDSNGNVATLTSGPYENSVFSQEKKQINAPDTPTKSMDTSDGPGETVLGMNTSHNREHASYYNETLDLSQEDIQRTLSANMPINCSSLSQHRRVSVHKSPSPHPMVQEISPMELMDSPPTVVDDDVFVNLDAFDMLGDFPELEVLDHSTHTSATSLSNDEPGSKDVKDEGGGRKQQREGSTSITDYSPEWAYPEGGVKVLVTGPWYSSNARYSVLFDSLPVPTNLVQSGVLRCYCPAHEVGLATLQVACEGFVISNSVMFEYKRPPTEDGLALKEPKVEESENLLKFTLLQRLESVDARLDIKQEPVNSDMSDAISLREHGPRLEARLVRLCQEMTSRTWREDLGEELSAGHRGMSLLHLAARLGFPRLVGALLDWRADNTSSLLEMEVDAMRRDDDGATPLMHACAYGHREAALLLYRWNRAALRLLNHRGLTALQLARANGHGPLADTLERLDSGLEGKHTFGSSQSSSPQVSPSDSLASIMSSQSHDGVFLRPDPVRPPDTAQYKQRSLTISPTLGLGELHRLVKRPSVDSGIHLGSSQGDAVPSARTVNPKPTLSSGSASRLSRFDRSMSVPLHPPLLSDLLDSPLSLGQHHSSGRRMDFALCEVASLGPRSNSPLGDVDNFSEDETDISHSHVGEQDVQMLTLAEQIIAAIPDRIKIESEEMQLDGSPACEALPPSPLLEPLMDPLDHSSPTSFHFEFSDHNYRYYDVATPSSSQSPASSSLQSPSPSFALDSPSPPPTTQDFCEFFHASGSIFENDFSNLTLSDREQRELYEAAKVIQKAYRSYKGRMKDMEQDKERAAAVLIQNYYRRYKQYAYFKQMTRAAMVIQNKYRSYCEHKRFKKSQEAAVCIQNYYRHYKELGQASPCTGFKRTYSQRRQHQAACKIQQFMRQSKNKLQKERALAAESEKQAARPSYQAVPPKLPSPGNSDPNNRNCDRSPDRGAS